MDSPDEPTVRVVALVLAGGVGARMRGPVPRQFLVVRNKPVLVYTLEAFQRAVAVEDNIVVSLPEWTGIVEQYVKDCGLTKVRSVIPGGASGFDSIPCGLHYLEKQYSPEDIILIHDVVRPLLTEEVINANIAGVEQYGNAVTVVPATEALLHTDDGESSSRVVERSHIMRTQTPQSLRLRELSLIHRQADEMGIHDSVATCTLLIETGHVVHAVAGDNSSFKLTSSEDVALFEAYLDADILQQDVNGLADAHLDLWRELDGCRILITTGFVGSFILHLITALCRRHGLHIHILALVRSRKRLREVLGDDREGSWLQVVEQDLRAPLSLKNEGPIEYCIHAASNADPVAYQSDFLGTMMTNVVGTEQILQYLAGLGTKPLRVVYLSSVEAYGGHSRKGILKKGDRGSFDPVAVRNCYLISKVAAENLCAGARLQLGLPVTVARMAYLYGPGDRLDDPKIVTLFLRMLQEGRDIEMHSPGLQRRSYCYIKDAVYGIMLLLLRGQDSTYNIAKGKEEVTIAGVARKLTRLFGRPGGLVRYEQPDQEELARFSPPEDNNLDTSKIRALGFEAEVGLVQGLERTGRYFGMRPSTW